MLVSSRSRVLLIILSLCAVLGASATTVGDTTQVLRLRHEDDEPENKPDLHARKTHDAPLLELNETEILRWHAPDPMSYWEHDFESHEEDNKNWRGLMGLHIFGMGFAFFIVLPIGISLRSLRHPWRGPVLITFNVVAWLSTAAGSLYKKLTGDLYKGSVHGRGGYLVLLLATGLAAFDALKFFQRAYAFLKGPQRRNIRLFWRTVILNQQSSLSSEYTSLINEAEEYSAVALTHPHDEETKDAPQSPQSFESIRQDDWPQSHTSHHTFVNQQFHVRHNTVMSNQSDETIHTPGLFLRSETIGSQDDAEPPSRLSRIGRIAIATAERCLVVLAFMQFLSGVTIYTGICRQNYINGCMAHLIKGGIFWCYGLLSFGRYLGAWADLGWAWNRLPPRRAQKVPTAEFVESLIIFLYGITNTWMERFGAKPGSPYTMKQRQHISIAVMFWLAGILGMIIESRRIRRWLSSSALSIVKPDQQISEPPSYSGSFNPFPAVVIGVTGAAMSAHHQTYLFQVEIHALWGYLLVGFAVLRCLTYFFLWLRPPHSILPSRPPTEAVGSFFLACGGLVFILSTEPIAYATIRRGLDDKMFFFNFAVAVTCFVFCWVMFITAFKGWVAYRMRTSSTPAPLSHKVLFNEHAA